MYVYLSDYACAVSVQKSKSSNQLCVMKWESVIDVHVRTNESIQLRALEYSSATVYVFPFSAEAISNQVHH